MSGQSSLLTAFNDHFIEFVSDIQNVFPDDPDILTAKNAFILMRKTNPKLIVHIWNSHVVGKYKQVIDEGNIDFFINKDYAQDLQTSSHSAKIIEAIDRLRNPVKAMSNENQKKTMKYIQNLTKISMLYEFGKS